MKRPETHRCIVNPENIPVIESIALSFFPNHKIPQTSLMRMMFLAESRNIINYCKHLTTY